MECEPTDFGIGSSDAGGEQGRAAKRVGDLLVAKVPLGAEGSPAIMKGRIRADFVRVDRVGVRTWHECSIDARWTVGRCASAHRGGPGCNDRVRSGMDTNTGEMSHLGSHEGF